MLRVESRRESGNEFQTIRAATGNNRHPNLLRRCLSTTSWHWLADCRHWRLESQMYRCSSPTSTGEHDSERVYANGSGAPSPLGVIMDATEKVKAHVFLLVCTRKGIWPIELHVRARYFQCGNRLTPVYLENGCVYSVWDCAYECSQLLLCFVALC